jgi:hypothetical protein
MRIVLFLFMYLLILIYFVTLYSIKGLVLGICVIIIIQLLLIHNRNAFINGHEHPHYDYRTIYNNVKHGDIVFTTGYETRGTFDNFLVLVNKGIVHGGIIVEENGVKYLVHAFPGNWNRPHVDEDKFIKGLSIPFRLYKEPFITPMLRENNTFFYQVFRHPTFTLSFENGLQLPKNRYFHFCTSSISQPLIQNGIIRHENEKVISYQPDSLLHQLHNFGYESFYMVHDRSLD